MFQHKNGFPSFQITPAAECPYLDGRKEQKIFTIATKSDSVSLYDTLAKQGFRRSQYILYKPLCVNCNACLSVRIRVHDFIPSTSQKRILAHNRYLKRQISQPVADQSHYKIFKKYLTHRHGDSEMSEMSEYDYQDMVESSAINTWLIIYYAEKRRDNNSKPVAVCITDVLDDGLSMLYSYFDPAFSKSSLGTYMVLDNVEIAKKSNANLKYLYLGYWIPTSKKMDYKSRFSPLEVLRNGQWIELKHPKSYTPDYFPEE